MEACERCAGLDAQLKELFVAWEEIQQLKALLQERPTQLLTVRDPEEPLWQERYNAIKAAYIKTRLEVSGSFGNWSGDTRRRVLENEISAELGFKI